MAKITKPSPPEHIVTVDTNILWHDDKGYAVNPEFDEFWQKHSGGFPMKLVIPDVVFGELLYQRACRKTPKSTAPSIPSTFSDYLIAFDPSGYPPAVSITRVVLFP